MRGFLIRIMLYGLAIALALFGVVLLADGTTDPYYLRLTTPRQAGLIVGTSRAAQGLIPHLMPAGRSPDYNFSFTGLHSPYGPTYLEAIGKKMDPQARDAHHIVAIEPWGLCADKADPNDSSLFPESALFLGTLPRMDVNPNICYFLQGGVERLWDVIAHRIEPDRMVVQADGWLQVDINRSPVEVQARLDDGMRENRSKARTLAYSAVREDYLHRTVQLLRSTGRVCLVRMPVSPPLRALEDSVVPDLGLRMRAIGAELGAPYLDLSAAEGYTFTDGSHLNQASARRLSAVLMDLCDGAAGPASLP
jgi:hypothetical protein